MHVDVCGIIHGVAMSDLSSSNYGLTHTQVSEVTGYLFANFYCVAVKFVPLVSHSKKKKQ